MGSCVSLRKDPDSALKLRLDFRSKTDKLVNPSPDKHNHMVADTVIKPHWSPASRDFGKDRVILIRYQQEMFREHFKLDEELVDEKENKDIYASSKEETFFDSHPWLESDCEDDFFSVNGDFTPSRGNTPVHESFSVRTPGANRQLFAEKTFKNNSKPEPSPTNKKKRLSELFKDPIGGDRDEKEDVGGSSKSQRSTPNVSDLNSGSWERTPNGDVKPVVERSVKSAQCCLPRLRSFSERKKRTSPPTSSVE